MIKKIAPLLLVAVALAVYAPALRAGFVWDDRALILSDPLIRSWRLTWEGFQHFLFTDAAASDFYRPLQRLSYLLDYAAFVFAPAGYHLVSILWHGAAAVALFFFAEELLAFLRMEPARRALDRIFRRADLDGASGAERGGRLCFGSRRSAGGGLWFSRALSRIAHAARDRRAEMGARPSAPASACSRAR